MIDFLLLLAQLDRAKRLFYNTVIGPYEDSKILATATSWAGKDPQELDRHHGAQDLRQGHDVRGHPNADRRQAVCRAFADNLKRIGALALGLEFDQMEWFRGDRLLDIGGLPPQWPAEFDRDRPPVPPEPRRRGARCSPNFWVDQVLPIDKARREADLATTRSNELPTWAVVTDVRFPGRGPRVLTSVVRSWEVVRPSWNEPRQRDSATEVTW